MQIFFFFSHLSLSLSNAPYFLWSSGPRETIDGGGIFFLIGMVEVCNHYMPLFVGLSMIPYYSHSPTNEEILYYIDPILWTHFHTCTAYA